MTTFTFAFQLVDLDYRLTAPRIEAEIGPGGEVTSLWSVDGGDANQEQIDAFVALVGESYLDWIYKRAAKENGAVDDGCTAHKRRRDQRDILEGA